jgi:uncharacterized protein
MPTRIFVNLPVRDLAASMAFFKKLGFAFEPRFTDQTAACMVISENIFAMLLTHEKFKEFTSKEIADAGRVTEVLTCLALDSRAEVDRMSGAALQAGGTQARAPVDHGFMYERSFEDLDGHIWELIWLDLSALPAES